MEVYATILTAYRFKIGLQVNISNFRLNIRYKGWKFLLPIVVGKLTIAGPGLLDMAPMGRIGLVGFHSF